MHEYIQVGKGRDVGMQQIYKFEAKIASGVAEQVTSRDVYRIGHRLDFFRLLSFYHAHHGLYFNTCVTVWGAYAYTYVELIFRLMNWQNGSNKNLDSKGTVLNTAWVLQLGMLLAVPMITSLALEKGVRRALWEFMYMTLTGSPLFNIFHMGTKAHYFGQTIAFGGAAYRPTGRGFVVKREKFSELYRFYASSHFYLSFEFMWVMILFSLTGNINTSVADTGGSLWAVWVMVVCWLFAPFWFNPLGFDWEQTLFDIKEWSLWMKRTDTRDCWLSWFYEEQKVFSDLSIGQRCLRASKSLLWIAVCFCLLEAMQRELCEMNPTQGQQDDCENDPTGFLLIISMLCLAAAAFAVFRKLKGEIGVQNQGLFRALKFVGFLVIVVAAVLVAIYIKGITLRYIILLIFTASFSAASIVTIFISFGARWRWLAQCCQLYEYLIGGLLFVPLVLLSAFGLVHDIQTRLMYGDAFGRCLKLVEVLRRTDGGSQASG
jgi:callose synthase